MLPTLRASGSALHAARLDPNHYWRASGSLSEVNARFRFAIVLILVGAILSTGEHHLRMFGLRRRHLPAGGPSSGPGGFRTFLNTASNRIARPVAPSNPPSYPKRIQLMGNSQSWRYFPASATLFYTPPPRICICIYMGFLRHRITPIEEYNETGRWSARLGMLFGPKRASYRFLRKFLCS